MDGVLLLLSPEIINNFLICLLLRVIGEFKTMLTFVLVLFPVFMLS